MTRPSISAARELLAALGALGLRDLVLAPGSRSAPLAYAAAEAADAGWLRLHVRIDERAAGFLALGLARGAALAGAPRPVAVVTTSGTAVANLHPAVLEAHHAGVPLLLLTADRPHELRGTGANQTTEQVGIFAGAVRWQADVPAPDGRAGEARDLRALAARAVAAALGARTGWPGPAHLNLSYRDPLAPEALDDDAAPVAEDRGQAGPTTASEPTVVVAAGEPAVDWPLDDRPTVLVAGDGAGPRATALAEARGWPLLAESVSGAAGGAHLVAAHALVLAESALADDVARVIVLGRPTLSRPVQRLLASAGEVVVVAPGAQPWPDAARRADVVLPGIPASWWEPAPSDHAWLDRWCAAGQRAADAVTAELAARPALTGLAVARAVAADLTPEDVLVVGSSNPARDLDTAAVWAQPPFVVANRGLAGIDGLVSTATGVALAAPAGARVRAYVGDLTFLHDVGGLLGAPGEPAPDLTIVVANDHGGSIFAGLEHGALGATTPARAATFERVFGTPHTVDVAALCRAYGVGHVAVHVAAGLAEALAAPSAGVRVVEARLTRSARRDDDASLRARVRAALHPTP